MKCLLYGSTYCEGKIYTLGLSAADDLGQAEEAGFDRAAAGRRR